MSGIITLTTDFSTSDAYVGVMKGAILSVARDVTIVDLAHDIAPHDVFQAAFVLESAYRHFPEGTVHVVVVDPRVGTSRRRLAMGCGNQYFVGPDNGVFSYSISNLGMCECVEIAPPPSDGRLRGITFEGRDIFAPAAARIASGVPLLEIGTPMDNPVVLEIPRPRIAAHAIDGRVIYIDHFGNCVSNIEATEVENFGGMPMVSVGGRTVGTLRSTYAEARVGEAIALINSVDHVEIAINQGSAEKALNVKVGTPVRVSLQK